jgi:hypothetical protein
MTGAHGFALLCHCELRFGGAKQSLYAIGRLLRVNKER